MSDQLAVAGITHTSYEPEALAYARFRAARCLLPMRHYPRWLSNLHATTLGKDAQLRSSHCFSSMSPLFLFGIYSTRILWLQARWRSPLP